MKLLVDGPLDVVRNQVAPDEGYATLELQCVRVQSMAKDMAAFPK